MVQTEEGRDEKGRNETGTEAGEERTTGPHESPRKWTRTAGPKMEGGRKIPHTIQPRKEFHKTPGPHRQGGLQGWVARNYDEAFFVASPYSFFPLVEELVGASNERPKLIPSATGHPRPVCNNFSDLLSAHLAV